MNVDWSNEEAKQLFDLWVRGKGGSDDDILRLASLAVELKATCHGTMLPETLSVTLRACEAASHPENRIGAARNLRKHISALGARNAVLEAELEKYRNSRCQRQECARERESVDVLRRLRYLDMEHEKITKREIGAFPSETVMGAARRLFQERKTLEDLNASADKEIIRLKQEVEQLKARVKDREETPGTYGHAHITKDEFNAISGDPDLAAYNTGAEAMRAACLKEVVEGLIRFGLPDSRPGMCDYLRMAILSVKL